MRWRSCKTSSMRAMELSPSLDIAAQRAAILQLATRFEAMDRMGVKLDRFGDTDKRLVDL